MDHRDRVALQPEADDDCRGQTHAVAGDGVVGFGERLQPQVIQKYSVPRQNEVEALILQPARIEHGAAPKAFPQHADIAAGNGDHHVGIKHHPHERGDHQIDHHARQMAIEKPPPPGWRRGGGCAVDWPKIRFQLTLHRLPPDEFAVLYTQVTNGKTNSSSQHGHGHRQEDQPPAYRRWPSGNPRLSAFCRSAPAVRFMAFEIRFTGDFLRECAFKSRTSALDQARRLTRLARLLAICPSSAAAAAIRPSIAEQMRDEKQSGSAAGSSSVPGLTLRPLADPRECVSQTHLIGVKPQRCLLNSQPRSVPKIGFCNNSDQGLR